MSSESHKTTVGDLVSSRLLSVTPETTLKAAANVMREEGIGSLLVHDQDKAIGMITDRDMIVRAFADGYDPASATVGQFMTHRVVTCDEDSSLEEAVELMRRENVRRLVICDGNGNTLGVLSVDDLALEIQDDRLYHELMRGVSHPRRAA